MCVVPEFFSSCTLPRPFVPPQVSELLKFTCTRPDVRSRDIHHIMGRNDYQRSALRQLHGARTL